MEENRKRIFILFAVVALVFAVSSCDANLTGVEDSPEPGIVRVTMISDPADTYLVERSDTFSVFTPYETSFNVNIFQGRVYSGANFAVLFPDTRSYAQRDSIYNIIDVDMTVEELSDIAGKIERGELKLTDLTAEYKKYTVFESNVPPGDYDKLSVGISAPNDLEKSRVTLVAYSGKRFSIPLELPPDANLLMDFNVDFNVASGEVTQINLQVKPFKSVYRYRDAYRFNRQVEVTGVEYP